MSDMNIALILKLVDQASAPARTAMKNLRGMGDRLDEMSRRASAWGQKQRELSEQRGRQLRGETMELAGMGLALYGYMKPAMEFEAQMSKVGAVSNANMQEIAALTASARELGATTPWSARQAAQGMEYLAMAGFQVNETVAAMPGLLSLASAAGEDLARTSDLASNILTGFGMQAGEMGHLGDVLTNTFTTSNTTLSMLGQTMKYVAPIAAEAGLSLEQTAAMAGRLGDAGIQGEQSGTALRAVISRLAAPSKEAAKVLKSLGIEIKDAKGNMRDIPTILAEMDEAMKDMGAGARLELMSTVFGMEATTAASVLLDQAGSGALQDYAQSLEQTGTAARVAAQMNENAIGGLKELNSGYEALMITLGNTAIPILVELTNSVIPVVRAIEGWVAANPELARNVAYLAAGLFALKLASLAVRWPLHLVWSALIRLDTVLALATRGVWLLLWAFAALITPVGLAAAAMVAAATLIYDNWAEIDVYFERKLGRVRAAFDENLGAGLQTMIAEANPFAIWFDGLDGMMDKYFGVDLVAAFETLQNSQSLLQAGVDFWARFWQSTKAAMQLDLKGAAEIMAGAFWIDLTEQGMEMIASLMRGAWGALVKAVADIQAKLMEIVPDWMLRWMEGSGSAEESSNGASGSWEAPGRALGGPVRAGFMYRINEEGQEFFSPGVSGRVVTARDARGGALGGGAISMGDVHVHAAPGMDPEGLARLVQRRIREELEEAQAALLHDGGAYAR